VREHTMVTTGSAPEGRCGACGGVWVKNMDINPYNRKPNWKSITGEYQQQECSRDKNLHVSGCNCRDCEKSF